MKKTILTLASVAFLFAACNNAPTTTETEDVATEETTDAVAQESTDEAAPADADGDVAIIEIEGNDQMKFNLSEIKVREGQTVKLTLHHVGKAPVVAMGHNFVLLAQGTNAVEFATKAIKAKDNDYIPADLESNVIAHTKLIGGGESTSIEFEAPEKGEYDFLCTFPGHSALMKGKFIVE